MLRFHFEIIRARPPDANRFTLPAIFAEGLWLPALRSVLFAGSVGALTLDPLREPTIAVLAVLGFGALFF